MGVHLVAACGVGMSALAGLLRAAGHSVTGSDEHVYPPASTLLEGLGIPVLQGYDPARLGGVDLVVCGNAVGRTNPEAEAAEAAGPACSPCRRPWGRWSSPAARRPWWPARTAR